MKVRWMAAVGVEVPKLSPIQRGVSINSRRVEGLAIDRPAFLHASIRKVEESCRRGILLIERFKIAQSLGNAAVIGDNIVLRNTHASGDLASVMRFDVVRQEADGSWKHSIESPDCRALAR